MSSLPEYCSESEGIVIEDSDKGIISTSEDIVKDLISQKVEDLQLVNHNTRLLFPGLLVCARQQSEAFDIRGKFRCRSRAFALALRRGDDSKSCLEAL